MATKRIRKIPGFSCIESLQSPKENKGSQDADDELDTSKEAVAKRTYRYLQLVDKQTMFGITNVLNPTQETLAKLNITHAKKPLMELAKPGDLKEHLDESITVGNDKFWSSTRMQEYITHLENFVNLNVRMATPYRHQRKKVIRGAISNGREWMFIILTFHADGSASYTSSQDIEFEEDITG
ncbi:hypothetical protein BDQ17DRAFT_1421780 [Cyathus striatus]|nr:hypothetical protein BDQ17DRAFT_1421780 [Cyathus striatus]